MAGLGIAVGVLCKISTALRIRYRRGKRPEHFIEASVRTGRRAFVGQATRPINLRIGM